jgi:hypothetical protein
MTVEERVDRVASKLRTATARGVVPFGADVHGFKLLPVVDPPELTVFEAAHGITLPDEYRAFLTRVSRGGAGPAYGLFPFEKILWPKLTPLPPTFLATPFPFETTFQPNLYAEEDEAEPSSVRERSGTVVLCDEGCGYQHFLVCSGPTRGQMWIDNTVSEGPYSPLGVGFLDWYERWLDDALIGGRGTWWMRSASDDPAFREATRQVKPWWRR